MLLLARCRVPLKAPEPQVPPIYILYAYTPRDNSITGDLIVQALSSRPEQIISEAESLR